MHPTKLKESETVCNVKDISTKPPQTWSAAVFTRYCAEPTWISRKSLYMCTGGLVLVFIMHVMGGQKTQWTITEGASRAKCCRTPLQMRTKQTRPLWRLQRVEVLLKLQEQQLKCAVTFKATLKWADDPQPYGWDEDKWPLPAQLIKSRVYRRETFTSDLNVSRDPEEPL